MPLEAPPPYEVANLLGDLERFLHSDVPLPLLIRIGLAHSQFETIHPFLDGNGRVGRLLITFLLLREQHRQLITDEFGRAAGNGHRVLEHLYQQPIISVANVQELIETSYPAANNLVQQFERHGLLQEMTGRRRNRRFVYRAYIGLFNDGANDAGAPG